MFKSASIVITLAVNDKEQRGKTLGILASEQFPCPRDSLQVLRQKCFNQSFKCAEKESFSAGPTKSHDLFLKLEKSFPARQKNLED